jgi:predicted nucleic acid-binding protein
MAGRVLSDASPLIGLARVEGLDWLNALFGVVWVPREVRNEVLSGRALPDERAILAAFDKGGLQVCEDAPDFPFAFPLTAPELPDLDEGEAACIRIALASPTPTLLLMDELAGRAIAMEHGLRVAGTAAVIGMARSRGLIPSARDVFVRLHASDFRISASVIAEILRRVNEG